MVASPPWLKIGAMVLPGVLLCGPSAATTLGSATIRRALVAPCAGSYCPAVAVPSSSSSTFRWYPAAPPPALHSSSAIMKPSRMRTAVSASAPVSDRSIPTVTAFPSARAPAINAGLINAETANRPSVERRVTCCMIAAPRNRGFPDRLVLLLFLDVRNRL